MLPTPRQQQEVTDETIEVLRRSNGTLVVIDGGSGTGKTGVLVRTAQALGKPVYEYASADELPEVKPDGIVVLDDDEWNEVTPEQIAAGRYRIVDILTVNSARGLAALGSRVQKPSDVFPKTTIDCKIYNLEALPDAEIRTFALQINPKRTSTEVELIVRYSFGIRFLIVNMAKAEAELTEEKAKAIMNAYVRSISRHRDVIKGVIAATTGRQIEVDEAELNLDFNSLLKARPSLSIDYPEPKDPETRAIYEAAVNSRDSHRAAVQFLISAIDRSLLQQWGYAVAEESEEDRLRDQLPGARRLFGQNARKVYYGKTGWASPITAVPHFRYRFGALQEATRKHFGRLAEEHPDAFMIRAFDHDNALAAPAVVGYTTEAFLQSAGIGYYAYNPMAEEGKQFYRYDPGKERIEFSQPLTK